MTDQHARRPIRLRGDWSGGLGDDPPERIILGNLHREHTLAARLERPPSPEDHAARIGIAGRDALRIQIAPLMPAGG
jgi:hypothetical protein